MKSGCTMRDVAQRAGVHVTTVSLALRNHPRLPEATRARIQALAEEMGYSRNPLVSSLMESRGRRQAPGRLKIAYACSFQGDGGWIDREEALPDYYSVASRRAPIHGLELEKFDISRARIGSERFLGILKSRGILGLIIGPLPEATECPRFDLSGVAVVSLGRRSVLRGVHRVANNQGQCMRMVLRCCVKNGYSRVGLCMIQKRRWEGAWEDTVGSYFAWTAEKSFKGLEALRPHMPACFDEEAFRQWLAENRPEVIITNHPEVILPALQADGWSVPGQIGVLGLGCNELKGGISGVHENHVGVAEAAVDLLSSLIVHNEFGPAAHPREILLMGSWVKGETFAYRSEE